MIDAKEDNQEPYSIRTYIYALSVIVLLVTSGTAAYLYWMDSQSQKTIQTSNKFHLATIIHINNIKHDLQQMENLLIHGDIIDIESSTVETAPSSTGIEAHLARIKKNVDALLKLKEKHAGEESFIGIFSEKFNQFKLSFEGERPMRNLDEKSVSNIFRPMRTSLLQLERLHLTVNAQSLEEYSHQKRETTRNFLALAVAILIAGLAAVTRAL